MVPENRFCISAMQTGFVKQTGAFTRDRGAIRFKHDFGTSGSESEAIQYFYCSDFFLTSGSGASPHVRKCIKSAATKVGWPGNFAPAFLGQ